MVGTRSDTEKLGSEKGQELLEYRGRRVEVERILRAALFENKHGKRQVSLRRRRDWASKGTCGAGRILS